MITIFRKVILFCILCFCASDLVSQIESGKIIFERKTNLLKKFKESEAKQWLGNDNKIKVEVFELYFNDSLSLFKPQESDLKDEISWATSKNTVYQNFNTNIIFSIKMIFGESVYVQDTLIKRQWKITDSKRKISGFSCRKAIWEMNDSTRIYAWYADDIVPNVGPESFCGLPGAILGLATEDGGVIYFAKSVEPMKPTLEMLSPDKVKKKIYSTAELKSKLEKEFGNKPWGKRTLKEVFSW